jgi:hypothetical protein
MCEVWASEWLAAERAGVCRTGLADSLGLGPIADRTRLRNSQKSEIQNLNKKTKLEN